MFSKRFANPGVGRKTWNSGSEPRKRSLGCQSRLIRMAEFRILALAGIRNHPYERYGKMFFRSDANAVGQLIILIAFFRVVKTTMQC